MAVPYNSPTFIGYNRFTGTLEYTGVSHGKGLGAFRQSCRIGDYQWLAPAQQGTVGTLHYSNWTYVDGPTIGPGYWGCAVDETEDYVVFAPHEASDIAIYRISTDTTIYIPHNQGANAFTGVVYTENGQYYFSPYDSPNICRLDLETFRITNDSNDIKFIEIQPHSQPAGAFAGISYAKGIVDTEPDRILFTPFNAPAIGQYNLESNYFKLTSETEFTIGQSYMGSSNISSIINFAPYDADAFFETYNQSRWTETDTVISDQTELFSIAFPAAGGTGNNHIVIYTDKTIMIYDVERDEYIPVINPSLDTVYALDISKFGAPSVTPYTPPKATDYVVLNDIILFTTEDDTIYELTRKFDDTGKAFFEFGEWNFTEAQNPITSNGVSTARVSLPIAYRPDGSFEGDTRWNKDNYYYTVDSSHIYDGYKTNYRNEFEIDAETKGARVLLVITSQKFNTQWVDYTDGTNDWRRLTLSVATDLPVGPDQPWFTVDETTFDQNGYQSYEVLPNTATTYNGYIVIPEADDDFTPGSGADVRPRYVGIIMNDIDAVESTRFDGFDEFFNPLFTAVDVDGVIAEGTDIKKVIKSYTTDPNFIGGEQIKIAGNEDQNSITITENDTRTVSSIDGLPVFDNLPAGWVFNDENQQVRDIDFQTEIHEDWGSSVTINKTVDLGMVLGDWEFRTAGNWTGTYTLQSFRGVNWTTEKVVTSAADFNIIINDGRESDYGIPYRLVIDLVTSGGSQAVRAGYTFSWDNFNCFYIEGNKCQETFSEWYSTTAARAYDSIVFHQQRLWLSYEATIYASGVNNINQFANYGIPTDDAPLAYRLADTQTAIINWMHVIGQDIIIGTTAALWSLRSETGILTPSTTTAIQQTSFATADIKPINIGNEMLFVDAKRTRVYASQYDWQSETFLSDDITAYSADAFDSKIINIVYDQIEKLLYITVEYNLPYTLDMGYVDGINTYRQLITINYDKRQGIIGTSQNTYYYPSNITSDRALAAIDNVVNLNNISYSVKVPNKVDNAFENGAESKFILNKIKRDITGDSFLSSYVAKRVNSSDIFDVYENIPCYYRSTFERNWKRGIITQEIFDRHVTPVNDTSKPVAPEDIRYEYWDEVTIPPDYYQGIEIMLPTEFTMTTFPIDYGQAGPEQTFTKRKNLSEVTVLTSNTAGGYIQWNPGDKENYADGIYNDQFSEYYPEAVSGQFPVSAFSTWDPNISLTIFEDSPHKMEIHGLVYQFVQGK
jgi:hypothetical protein